MNVINPLFKDADKHPESVFIFQKVKGRDSLHGKKAVDIFSLPFKNVEEIKEAVADPNPEKLEEILSLVFEGVNFNTLKLLQFFECYNYIVEQVKIIYKKEKVLSSPPSEKLKNAGIERLSIFGALNILDDIAQRYGKSPMEVEEWPYSLIFSLSLKIKIEGEIKNNLTMQNK